MADNFDRLGEKGYNWADRQAGKLADRPKWTAFKWIGGLIALFIVIGIVSSVLGFFGDHAASLKQTVEPYNVREQNRAIVGDWQDMKAAAANACDAAEAKTNADSPTFLEDPAVSYKATYRRIEADYDRRMANIYEAQLVRKFPVPSNLRSYPKVAPTLKEMQAQVC